MLRTVWFPAKPIKCPLCDGTFEVDLSLHPRLRSMRKTQTLPKYQTEALGFEERDEGQTQGDG